MIEINRKFTSKFVILFITYGYQDYYMYNLIAKFTRVRESNNKNSIVDYVLIDRKHFKQFKTVRK